MPSSNEFLSSLVSEWYDPLFRFAYSLCHSSDDAMDLTQNAFLKMTRKIHTLRDRSKAKSWLFQTVRNEFVDEYRRERRYPVQPIDHTPSSNLAVEAIPGRGMDARNIVATLGTLEERFRAPLALFYLQSFSYREIADILPGASQGPPERLSRPPRRRAGPRRQPRRRVAPRANLAAPPAAPHRPRGPAPAPGARTPASGAWGLAGRLSEPSAGRAARSARKRVAGSLRARVPANKPPRSDLLERR